MNFNVTFITILVIVLLYIPGYFFKRFYYTGKFTKQFTWGNFTERFITSTFWGILIQLLGIILWYIVLHPDIDSIKNPVSEFYTDLLSNKIPNCTFDNLIYATKYICSIILLATFLGYSCHKAVRFLRLDRMFPVLRFANYWNYYFRGEGIIKKGKWVSTTIDVIVDDGSEKGRLYRGFLSDYTLSGTTGELETIVIFDAQRWSTTVNGFKTIPGDCFIIPFSRVRNFNLQYSTKARTTEFMSVVVAVLMLLILPAILFFIPYLFYKEIGLLRVLLGILFSSMTWLLFLTLIYGDSPSTSTATAPTTRRDKLNFKIVVIVFIAACLFITYKMLF